MQLMRRLVRQMETQPNLFMQFVFSLIIIE